MKLLVINPNTHAPMTRHIGDAARAAASPGTEVAAVVRDISATGLFVRLAAELAIGAEVACELSLPGPDLSTSHHRAWARVVRKGDHGYGLELLDPSHELVEAILGLA